jgi:polysaccharide export outer membrane protein
MLSLLVAACAALPAAAPTSGELESRTNDLGFDYYSVLVDSHVIALLQQYSTSFGARFKGAHYAANNSLHPGDTVSITVYETGGSTLFPPPAVLPGASITGVPGAVSPGASTIPPQMIEADGTIGVPFVGRIKVAGQTPGQVARIVEQALEGKAVSPQVVVTLVNGVSNVATVGGEVNAARVVPLTLRGDRLLDVIGNAGGSKYPAYETYVRVLRQNYVGSVLLQTVVNNPAENISIRPNDQIYLTHYPRSFAVLGATSRVALYPFAAEKVTLAEGVAQAGGPIDTIGDPSGIYLFRFEPWSIAKEVLGPEQVAAVGSVPPEFVPVLYHVQLRDAAGYFAAQAIQMRDKDVVLITNAPATQLQKALAIIRGFTGIAYDLKKNATN